MIIKFEKSFDKQFKKMLKNLKNKFYERLELFRQDKFQYLLNNHSLTGEWDGHRSINITGNYRAVYYEYNNEIRFVAIGTHSQLYKK